MVARTAVHRPPSFSSLNPMLKPAVRGYLSAQGGAIHPSLHEGRQSSPPLVTGNNELWNRSKNHRAKRHPGRLQSEWPADFNWSARPTSRESAAQRLSGSFYGLSYRACAFRRARGSVEGAA